MKKCYSSTIMTLFFIFSFTKAFTQDIDSMMNVYADRTAPERIHIHFDKIMYNKGETVWYKVYFLQGRDSGLASMNVYLEWYGTDGKLIARSAAPIVLSSSSGSFDIPTDYKGKVLEVRAFTRWMLNDDTAFMYRRQLMINDGISTPPVAAPPPTRVTLFPEGGFLIQGLRSRIAFKATNSFGDPVFIKAVLTDDENNTLDSVHALHDGMGSFSLAPSAAHSYYFKWTDEYGITGTIAVPVPKPEGALLSITGKKDKAICRIDRSANAPDNFKKMILVVHMNRTGLYQVAINTTEKRSLSAEIPVSDLPTGLLQFTLFTSDWIPIAERVLFINNQAHEFNVSITAPLINVDARGKNMLDLYVPDTLFTNMSLAITDAAVSTTDQHSIFSDLLLSGDIKGKLYNAAYYLSANTEEIKDHTDLVMLTNGWRRFDWDKIKAHIAPKINYPVENEYMKLIGKVSGVKSKEAGELNMIVVSKDSSRQFISAPLQKDGSFEYPIAIFDTASIMFSINNKPLLSEKMKLQVSNGLLQMPLKNIPPINIDANSGDPQVIQKLALVLAEEELLRKKMAETTLKEVIVTTRIKSKVEQLDEKYSSGFFRGNASRKSYVLDVSDPNSIRSSATVMEYLTSRVPGLMVNGTNLQWRGSAPMLFLNEMRTDIATLASIPLTSIAMIKAFPPIFMFVAGGGEGGAVAVYTRVGDDQNLQPETAGLQSVKLAGYTQFREFYHPSYEQPDSSFTKPDNRTTLYWNPHLITNRAQQRLQIEYFNNDFTKSFKLVLEGINAAGKMTRVIKTIGPGGKIE